MCKGMLPPGVNPIAVKYIISYIITYHISYHHVISYIMSYHIIYHIISYHIIVSYHIISYHISYNIISITGIDNLCKLEFVVFTSVHVAYPKSAICLQLRWYWSFKVLDDPRIRPESVLNVDLTLNGIGCVWNRTVERCDNGCRWCLRVWMFWVRRPVIVNEGFVVRRFYTFMKSCF